MMCDVMQLKMAGIGWIPLLVSPAAFFTGVAVADENGSANKVIDFSIMNG